MDIFIFFNIDVSYLRYCGVVEVIVGFVDRIRVKELVDVLKKEIENYVVIIIKEVSDKVFVVIVNLVRDYDKVNIFLVKFFVEKFGILEGEGILKEFMKEYLKKFVEKEKEFEEVKKEVLKFVEKYYDDVLFYKELVDNECDKLMVLLMFVRINMMFVFIGWVLRLDV